MHLKCASGEESVEAKPSADFTNEPYKFVESLRDGGGIIMCDKLSGRVHVDLYGYILVHRKT